MQILNGYSLDETKWKTRGGGGQCNIAARDGKQYFIKRLTKPRYPESDKFTGEYKQIKIEECNAWLRKRREIVNVLPGNGTGTMVKPIEYFREGSCFYEVANLVDVTNIPYDEIWKESKTDKARIMLTVAMSLADMHKAGVVHGDLDPGNILISRAAGGNLVTKLIDFTDSFFETDPPEKIMSKEFWWSPEIALYSKGSNQHPNPYREHISCKADVFSLGVIFHQYCSKDGKPPIITMPQPWQEFQVGKKPLVDPDIEPEFRDLIKSMLEIEPGNRPSMASVHKTLLGIFRPLPKPVLNDGSKTEEESHKTLTYGEKLLKKWGKRNARKKSEKEEGKRLADSGKNGSAVTGTEVPAGDGISHNGARVQNAYMLNSKKVKVCFIDGNEQIMDLKFAIHQNYVKKH